MNENKIIYEISAHQVILLTAGCVLMGVLIGWFTSPI